MTKIKIENGKGNACRNDNNPSFLGLTRESLDDKKIPAFAGMTENIRGAGMTDGVKRTGMTGERGSRGERGRSMVEMLGVLAIMAVLTIGAVAGYRYAVTKYQANETFNELRRRVVIHTQQSLTGAPLSQSEMGDTTRLGYPIEVSSLPDGLFALTLYNIDTRLCREMIRTGWTMPIQTYVNGMIAAVNLDICGEDNELVFRFRADMAGCQDDADCPCGTCDNGICQTTCATGETCAKDFDNGQYVCCGEEKIINGTCCQNPGENGTCCDENSKYCCPPDKPLYTFLGGCRSCEDMEEPGFYNNLVGGGATDNPVGLCQRCPNRVLIEHGYCVIPRCTTGQFMDRYGACHNCEDITRIYVGGAGAYGAKECPQRIHDAGFNYSTHCNYDLDVIFLDRNPEECAKCKGRYYAYPTCVRCPDDISTLTPAQQAQCTG